MTAAMVDWATRWKIDARAFAELQQILYVVDAAKPETPDEAGTAETTISSQIRVAASAAGVTLWRNNSGVGVNPAGRPVRFGLGNDSKKINAVRKSADLIGLTPRGRFVAVETKKSGWMWKGTDREQAQANFLNHVRKNNGIAMFATSWADVEKALT